MGTKEQWVQWDSLPRVTVATEEQRDSEHRGTVGTEEQWVQRDNG